MPRKNFTTGAPWEKKVGYSRAVRMGNVIEVSGTTAYENGSIVGLNDAYAQAKHILTTIGQVLVDAGSKLEDVVRTRMYVTNIEDWEAVGRAHGEFFSEIMPATTMVEVSKLIQPEMLVEIEVTAVIEGVRAIYWK